MKLVWKLLRQNMNAWQLAGFVLANLCGMAIILTGIQFYHDIIPLFTKGDSFMKPGQIVITKRVSALRTFSGKAPTFSKAETDDLKAQPFVNSIGMFTPSLYGVAATIGSQRLGMQFSTEMFFESVPDEFIDVDLTRWKYSEGEQEVPIILPRNYLNLYNFGFASSQGLPTVSEGLISAVGISLRLTGTAGTELKTGRVVAFSKRLNTILVPQQFMNEMNAKLSPDRQTEPSRLIADVKNPADERIANYLDQHGYDTETADTDASRTAALLRVIIAIVLVVGLIISALAFYVLLLSIFLLLQKHTEKIDNLLLIGYSPTAVSIPYHLLAIGLNAVVLVVSIVVALQARNYYLPHFGELYPKFEAAEFLPTALTGLALFILISLLNFIAIRRKVNSVWHMHE